MPKDKKITPAVALRGVVLFVLFGYWVVVSDPSVRSINAYWTMQFPNLDGLINGLFPYLFPVGMIIILGFSSRKPYASILIGSFPQVLYTALSVGWWVGEYPDLNAVAAFTHVSVSLLIYLLAWRELYESSTSTG